MNTKTLSLDVIQVAEPCTQAWDAMSGDERVRYCAGCRKHVYDLSAMTRGEAERLVCEAAGPLCVRFRRAEDGRVRTLEYERPTGRRRGWRFWTLASACAGSLAAAAGGHLFARGRVAPPPPVMGAMTVAPPPPRTQADASVLGRMMAPHATPATGPQSAPPPVG
jgi:hypothetical protein